MKFPADNFPRLEDKAQMIIKKRKWSMGNYLKLKFERRMVHLPSILSLQCILSVYTVSS